MTISSDTCLDPETKPSPTTDVALFCTPEYAGSLLGSFKNLPEGTAGGTEMTDKPAAWIRA